MPTPWEDSVRCDHCHDKAADERHRFCEYCGRQLSTPVENPIETATAVLDDLIEASAPSSIDVGEPAVAPVEAVSPAPQSARCESCGGPSGDADLCEACQRAFHAVIERRKPETSVEAEEDETEEDEFDEDDFADAFPAPSAEASAPVAPPPPAVPSVAAAAPVVAPFNPWAASPSFSSSPNASTTERQDVAPGGFLPLPAPVAPPVVAAPTETPAVPQQPAPQQSAPQPTAPPVAARPVPARELTRPMPRPRPVPPGGLPDATPPSSSGRTRAIFVAGALVVVALAICVPLGQPWLANAEPEPAPREEPQEPAPAQAVARPTPPPQRKEPVVENTASDPEPPRPVRQPKPARQEPRREAPAPAPAVEAIAETVLPAAEPVAAPPPAPEPAAPVGPFFETRQVNETPQIASRIEPRIPDDVQGPVSDVVIVRVLVSQTGHVSLVNVLRRSKTGVALDDAVVAAVKQWTFSPARKRGEPVSCWYHVGVPIQRAG
jgi:protein TonB